MHHGDGKMYHLHLPLKKMTLGHLNYEKLPSIRVKKDSFFPTRKFGTFFSLVVHAIVTTSKCQYLGRKHDSRRTNFFLI